MAHSLNFNFPHQNLNQNIALIQYRSFLFLKTHFRIFRNLFQIQLTFNDSSLTNQHFSAYFLKVCIKQKISKALKWYNLNIIGVDSFLQIPCLYFSDYLLVFYLNVIILPFLTCFAHFFFSTIDSKIMILHFFTVPHYSAFPQSEIFFCSNFRVFLTCLAMS